MFKLQSYRAQGVLDRGLTDRFECPHCGATMRIIALTEDADVVERILKHLKV